MVSADCSLSAQRTSSLVAITTVCPDTKKFPPRCRFFCVPYESIMDIVESRLQLLRQLARAIEKNDRELFCDHIQMGVAYFDQDVVAKLLQTELPLMLGEGLTERMNVFMFLPRLFGSSALEAK